MPFSVSWLEELEELPDEATLITPLSHKRFRISDAQETRRFPAAASSLV